MKNGQFPAVIKLADLNGQNGFKIDGENNGDQSGYSVSAVGDMNKDGYTDVFIGAPSFKPYGRSYVVFGGSTVGNNGLLALSSLNGANGFKLDGEQGGGAASGWSANMAEDVNSDGYDDLIIGAYGYQAVGRSYVIFGGPQVGINGLLPLSSLNGTNGFKLDGEFIGDNSGYSVSTAGDINKDGYADLLIGARNYGSTGGQYNGKGRSYVVFGGAQVGKSGLIALASLNGTNGFKLDGELSNDWSGYSVNTCGDINKDGYADVIVGAPPLVTMVETMMVMALVVVIWCLVDPRWVVVDY